ncbi:sugar ABC transporter substrate-binding protein [Salipaludibacillus agaradhaerens]|uniref:Sugar ABC transporter substrate-binding protein n=1 Tax=Salipaludibacillus agaradhaerens TaxID=76935 RepID=A0A9Q4AZ27_SALAG|nr:sugar ABC transporter substrate-binding protein [Salipaludibacillus agaradhaerens]MCR6095036.1 sugar ABC transporter substrate-binding protein [Salipaludibacillus agaradhaerens]MCR6115406.1 sugar ABC transporter substrate-binding protein [Salipaludibacillus agaradhaerens]
MKKTVLLCSAMVMMLAACGNEETTDNATDNNGGGETQTLTAWAWNINIPVLEEAAERFAEENPGFELDIVEQGTPDVYQQITTGLQAGGQGLPDIMLIEDDRVQGYLNSFPEAFLDLSEYGFDDEHGEKFPEFKTELLTLNDSIYGVPFDAGPAGVFYRVDLFEEAGIDADQIETWDDFIEAGHTLREELDVALTGIDINNDDGVYRIMLNQQGTFYFNEEGEINLNSQESIQAMEVVKRLHEEGLNENLVGWDAWLGGLANGNVATAPSGAWLTGSLTEQAPNLEGDWDVMPLPAFEEGGNRAANLGGSNYMISANSENPDLAYEFMAFFSTSEEVQLAAMEGGLFPSLNTIYEEGVFSEPVAYFNDQPIWDMFAGMMDDIPYANYTGNYAVARDEAETAQAEAVGGRSVEEALERAANQLDNRIN